MGQKLCGALAVGGLEGDLKRGLGAIGLFNFTLVENMGDNASLTIRTTGSKFDTEIALYDSMGLLVATNDDVAPKNSLSHLIFDANNRLSAGNYHVVLIGSNTVFGDGRITPGTSKGGVFQLKIQTTALVLTPVAPGYLARDGNILPTSIQETELASGSMEAGAVHRFDFTLENNILSGDWLTIDTQGIGFDSEIALYDAQGKLVATNDDISPRNSLSRLSFGLDGDNGRQLSAGDYTLLLGGFNTIFHDGLQAVNSSSWVGDYAVYVQSSSGITTAATRLLSASQSVPEPSSFALMGLGLLALVRSKRPLFTVSKNVYQE